MWVVKQTGIKLVLRFKMLSYNLTLGFFYGFILHALGHKIRIIGHLIFDQRFRNLSRFHESAFESERESYKMHVSLYIYIHVRSVTLTHRYHETVGHYFVRWCLVTLSLSLSIVILFVRVRVLSREHPDGETRAHVYTTVVNFQSNFITWPRRASRWPVCELTPLS